MIWWVLVTTGMFLSLYDLFPTTSFFRLPNSMYLSPLYPFRTGVETIRDGEYAGSTSFPEKRDIDAV
jgi:hypothetical protein